MNMDAFSNGSGLSAAWFNHFILIITGTLVTIACAAIIAMLKHHFDEKLTSHEWAIAYILFVVMVLFIFLGFLNNFWR